MVGTLTTHKPLRVVLKASQRFLSELIGEFTLDFADLSRPGVVSEGSRHFLVRHGLAVALASAPHLCQLFLVLGGELERSVV